MNDLITTVELLDQSGLSRRTLARWQRRGLVPRGQVGQHPSGRGKTAYFPASLVDTCRRIQRLQRQGYDLREVKEVLALEPVEQWIAASPTLWQLLGDDKFEYGGSQWGLLNAFVDISNFGRVIYDADFVEKAITELDRRRAFDLPLQILGAGAEPYLLFRVDRIEREKVKVVVGHDRGYFKTGDAEHLVVPLRPMLERFSKVTGSPLSPRRDADGADR